MSLRAIAVILFLTRKIQVIINVMYELISRREPREDSTGPSAYMIGENISADPFICVPHRNASIMSRVSVEATTAKIALAALKYGDLSNQPTKDYNFDLERFAAFEGNTGPYILYTIVRIKSILAKYGAWENLPIQVPANPYAKDLMLAITKFGPTMESALKTLSPNLICAYIYELSGAVNKFYHETRILTEENEELKAGYIALIGLAKRILETCIDILGFAAPEKM